MYIPISFAESTTNVNENSFRSLKYIFPPKEIFAKKKNKQNLVQYIVAWCAVCPQKHLKEQDAKKTKEACHHLVNKLHAKWSNLTVPLRQTGEGFCLYYEAQWLLPPVKYYCLCSSWSTFRFLHSFCQRFSCVWVNTKILNILINHCPFLACHKRKQLHSAFTEAPDSDYWHLKICLYEVKEVVLRCVEYMLPWLLW